MLKDGEVSTQRSPIRRYQDRTRDAPGAQELRSVTLFNWLQLWDWKTFTIRTRAPSWVIHYWLRYPADLEAATYNDFCCVKLMLHHPFNHIEELLSVDDVVYLSY